MTQKLPAANFWNFLYNKVQGRNCRLAVELLPSSHESPGKLQTGCILHKKKKCVTEAALECEPVDEENNCANFSSSTCVTLPIIIKLANICCNKISISQVIV